jgi:transcription-repair coupling factor (superfamily II helicase)
MFDFNNLLLNSSILYKTINELGNKQKINIVGLGEGEKTFLLSFVNKKIIYICPNDNLIKSIKINFQTLGRKVDCLLQNNISYFDEWQSNEEKEILDKLAKFENNEIDVLIVSVPLLFQRCFSKEIYDSHKIYLKTKNEINLDELTERLVNFGYDRVNMVEHSGQISKRGDILDVFSPGYKVPFRIEFFGDTIESIKFFNVVDYTTSCEIDNITIFPCSLLFIKEKEKEIIKLRIKKDYEKANKNDNLSNFINDIYEQIDSNVIKNRNYILPFTESYNDNFLSFFKNDLVVFDDFEELKSKVEDESEKLNDDYEQKFEQGLILPNLKNLFVQKDYLDCEYFLSFSSFLNQKVSFDKNIELSRFVLNNYYNKNELLINDINIFLSQGKKVCLFLENDEKLKYFSDFLTNKCDFSINSLDNSVCLFNQELYLSVSLKDEKLILIGSDSLSLNKNSLNKTISADKNNFYLPQVGDFVVHEIHGIGKCVEIKKINFNGFTKDYFVLSYDKGDILYVPTEQVNLISKYLGGESPKLNRLGGKQFELIKERVKQSVKKMAFDLVKLYAERQNKKGKTYESDDSLQKEFEDSFSYELTPDQKQAVSDCKSDMLSGKLMDRLICGDVGYGKTEVALRIAFKTIEEGGQVALLAPTTVLCEQHLSTINKRMSNFGIRAEVLDRFVPISKQKKIIEDLKNGEINFVCGTQRLLNKDINFKNLELLIVDEEQRFGVSDKEKIKNYKDNINVLTLSATPIPRTLHMGMVGIRDISIISTPPQDRLPVKVVVTEYNDLIVKDAISNELNRNGQVLIIYNRIESIFNFEGKIKEMFPKFRIGVAHGRMDETELENVIYKLYNGALDILISTTLIENGIDLPNANTLIVINADELGLSQLYQLKGRVGRSTRNAFAYFTYNKNKTLTDESYKRLKAISDFSELGSGFKIAMRDLEIRGAGNILGAEQHGHMEKVGYDLYCKLLNLAIKELKDGNNIEEKKEIKIDISINAYLPQEFVNDDEERIKIYSRIASINDENQIEKLKNDIVDIYGYIPNEVTELMYVALIKNLAQNIGSKRVVIKKYDCFIEFYEENKIINEKFNQVISSNENKFILKKEELPKLVLVDDLTTQQKQQAIIKLLIKLNKIFK